MSRWVATVRFAAAEFGPLIVFWVLAATLGVKPAILGSILFIAGDTLRRWRKGRKFTRLYLLVSAMTLVFGFVDLVSTSPFMLKYEAVVSNAATGLAFAAGALGEKPIIQEFAEQRESFVATNEVRAFFRLFTLVWAAYFFLKGALFAWMAWTMPMLEAMALRSLIGGVSLGLMIAVSVTQGRRLFFLCRRLGLLPEAARSASRAPAPTPPQVERAPPCASGAMKPTRAVRSSPLTAPGSARSEAQTGPAPPGSRRPWVHGRAASDSRRRHRNGPRISPSRRSASGTGRR